MSPLEQYLKTQFKTSQLNTVLHVSFSPCKTTLGHLQIDYSIWSPGEILTADTMAVDTETTVVEDDSHQIPELVLMTASSGQEHRIVSREDAADFLVAHRGCDLIGHNLASISHVLRQYFEQTRRYDACEVLFRAGDELRLHDTM